MTSDEYKRNIFTELILERKLSSDELMFPAPPDVPVTPSVVALDSDIYVTITILKNTRNFYFSTIQNRRIDKINKELINNGPDKTGMYCTTSI